MNRLLNPLAPGVCALCGKQGLVRKRLAASTRPAQDICTRCLPVDEIDLRREPEDAAPDAIRETDFLAALINRPRTKSSGR